LQVKERVRDFFCGILIGCANIIPGVSGGTVAVSTGVFDRAILALNGLIGDRGNRKTHLLTLLPLLVGVLAGLLLFSKLVSYLLDVAPLPTFAAFLGMVVGSLPMLGRNALKGIPAAERRMVPDCGGNRACNGIFGKRRVAERSVYVFQRRNPAACHDGLFREHGDAGTFRFVHHAALRAV